MIDFSRLNSESCNELTARAVEEGMTAVGYTCSYVPRAIFFRDDMFPLRVRAPEVTGTEVADTYMSSFTCSYCRSLLEQAFDGIYDFLGGWIFTSGCDHVRRLHDNLGPVASPSFNYIMDLPHKAGSSAIAWYSEEIRSLCNALEVHFGVSMDKKKIEESVNTHNQYVRTLKKIGDLRKEKDLTITGADFHEMLTAAMTSPWSGISEHLEKYYESVQKNGPLQPRARLLLAGAICDDPRYIAAVESQGGIVVADRYCTGSIPGLEEVRLKDDVYTSLAEHYLTKMTCPRMMENFRQRVDSIMEIIEEYRVDGVVIEVIKFCDLWGVETAPLIDALRKKGVPVLRLEREYRFTGEGQLKTRVQAFLESMGR